VSFRRERYIPRGGPDGGDGGRGGDVVLRVRPGLNTLLAFRARQKFLAGDGQRGRGKNQHGRNGVDVFVDVPPGTEVRDAESGALIADLKDPESPWIAARGGVGGRGNARFASPTRQAPRYAQPGLAGEERWLLLELKLLADVGLVGPPNAGKSSLIARVSAARPKIADYPFTTVTPNLGVVTLGEERTLTMADIPGLLEGAHRGVGMGLDFLRHIERTALLLYVLDVSGSSALDQFDAVRGELMRYHAPLVEKPCAVALNKIDLADSEHVAGMCADFALKGIDAYPVSAVTGAGVSTLLEGLYRMLAARRAEGPSAQEQLIYDV